MSEPTNSRPLIAADVLRAQLVDIAHLTHRSPDSFVRDASGLREDGAPELLAIWSRLDPAARYRLLGVAREMDRACHGGGGIDVSEAGPFRGHR